jgi:ribose-phosphate pyrophosphokinase
MSPSCLVLAAGTANPSLARAVARELDMPIAAADIGRFPDGEVRIRLDEPVRERDVVLLQPTAPPVNDNLMELLALADACRRASAERVIAVIPYFAYARSDRRDGRREPITASLVADLLECAGVDHVVLVDVHAPQLEGFFRIPVDHLSAVPALCDEIGPLLPAKTVVVSPDAGRVQMATEYARRLRKPLVLLHKRRESESETEVTHIVGDVRDQACLLIDDIISSGGTIAESARALHEAGAGRKFFVAATHGLLIGDACERMAASGVEHLFVTDSLAGPGERCAVDGLRLHVVSIATAVAAAIRLQLVERSDAKPRRIA